MLNDQGCAEAVRPRRPEMSNEFDCNDDCGHGDNSGSVATPSPAPPRTDPCRLLTAAEISAALGAPPGDATGPDPTRDSETGATIRSCTRTVGGMVLDVSVNDFPDAAAASRAMAQLGQREPGDEDEAKMVPVPGVGERSLFGATRIGAHWMTQRHGSTLVPTTTCGDGSRGTRVHHPTDR